MAAAPAQHGTLREIRNLHVVSGDGRTVDLRSVHCPQDDRAVTLEQCLCCTDNGGVAEDQEGRTEYIACRCSAPARRPGRALTPDQASETPISSVMTTYVLAFRPDVSLEVVAGLLLEHGIGGAPVVDPEGRPVGVVSKTDLIAERFMAGDTGEALARGERATRGHLRTEVGPGVHVEAGPRFTVSDAMTPGAFAIAERAPVAQAAALLALHGVHRVPVVSEDGRVAGIVTSSDLVRWLARRSGYLTRGAASPSSPA